MKKVTKFKRQPEDFEDHGKFKPIRKKSKKANLRPVDSYEKKPLKYYFEEE
jgi:hypothetical protein